MTSVKNEDVLIIAGRSFASRLFLGTGKFSSASVMVSAIEASGTEMVTVAMRRVDLNDPEDSFIQNIDKKKYLFLPNTSGARTADEAIRLARVSRAALDGNPWVKLEVTPEPRYLLPDPVETLKAAEILVREGFIVLPYINADPVLAKKLEDAGCAAVMPLAAPIGSNRGLKTADQIRIIISQSGVPVVVDAGLGAPSHAAEAMEMGADAVLVNTAIAAAARPAAAAAAFRMAVIAGRTGFLCGLACESIFAKASSPVKGIISSL